MVKRLFLTVVLILTFKTIFAVAFSFRVQCSSNSKENLISVFNKIPERKSYTLPTGATIYFSGGYFYTLEEALERLGQVQKLGIEDAFIRVFKNRSYLSDQVSSVLLSQLMMEYEKPRVTYDTAYMAEAKSKITQKNKKYYNIVETEATASGKGNSKEKEVAGSSAKEESSAAKTNQQTPSDLPKIKETVEELGTNIIVRELPQYKILIAKKTGKGPAPKELEQVNEIIYETKNGNIVYYTVGYFESYSQAKSAVELYKKSLSKSDVKVVGLYNGSVVSEGLAQDLEKLYYQQKKKK